MADRDYKLDGLKTNQDRFRFSNELSRKIYGAQNRANEIEPEAEYWSAVFTPSIEFIQRETAKAWGENDADWLPDVRATIETVVKIHSNAAEVLAPKLIEAAEQTWNALEQQKGAVQKTVESMTHSARERMVSLVQGRSITDRWNTAIGYLPAGVPQMIIQLIQTKGRSVDGMSREIEKMQIEPEAVGFEATTTYTWQLEQHVNGNAWLKDVNDLLRANNCDPSTRGKYWAELLLKGSRYL